MNATAPAIASGPKDEFHAERLTGLGGSDVAALLGLDPYKSAFAVFLEKTGQAPPEDLSDNEAVEWGLLLEEPVGRKFMRQTGKKIARVNKVLRHPYLPWAIAHIDYRVVGEKAVLEVKTANFWASRSEDWGESGSDVIPANYMCQVQWYLGVTNYPRAYVAVLLGGSMFRWYAIERDDDFIAELFARGAEMWACVESNTPPTDALTADEALAKFPTSVPKPIEATEEIARAVLRYLESKAAEKEALADRDGVYAQIAEYMGECDTLTFRGVPIMTWKSKSTGKRLDSKAHAAEQPECHARYTRDGSTRVMLPKEKFTL